MVASSRNALLQGEVRTELEGDAGRLKSGDVKGAEGEDEDVDVSAEKAVCDMLERGRRGAGLKHGLRVDGEEVPT